MDSMSAPSALRRRVRLALAAAALLLVAACSALRIGYNQADRMLAWSLDSYLDLRPAQDALVRERGARLLAWHRSTQLADYAGLMAQARTAIQRPLSAGEVLEWQAGVNRRLAAIGEAAAPDLAELAASLTPGQLQHLSERLAKDARKARREAAEQDEAERLSRAQERAQDWLGDLNPEQTALLRRHLTATAGDAAAWLAERERRQQELLAAIEPIAAGKLSSAEASRAIRELFARWAAAPDLARRELALRWRESNATLIAGLVNAASDRQRQHLARRLATYEEDFSLLAAEGTPRRG